MIRNKIICISYVFSILRMPKYHLEYGNSWLPIDTFSELISKVEMIILNKRFYGSMNDNDLLNVELAKRDMIV